MITCAECKKWRQHKARGVCGPCYQFLRYHKKELPDKVGHAQGRAVAEKDQQKTCGKCKNVKPLEDFPDFGPGKFGKSSECRACRTIYLRNYRRMRRAMDPDYNKGH